MPIVTELKYTTDLDRGVSMQMLKNAFLSGDQQAHRFVISCVRTATGKSVDLTQASVQGYLIRADGSTVVMDGTATANKVTVTLPAACYAVPGRFSLVIKASQGSVIHTLLWVEGAVSRSHTDTVVDPGQVVPSLDELMAKIAAMEQSTSAANAAAAAADIARQGIQNNLSMISSDVEKLKAFHRPVAKMDFQDITDTLEITVGSYYKYNTGEKLQQATSKSVYIPVSEGDVFRISAEIGYYIGLAVFFDAAGKHLGYQHSESGKVHVIGETVIIPAGCYFVSFATLTANGYPLVVEKQMLTTQSLYVAGDSIANGYGADGYAYGELLRDKYTMTLTKDAVNGTTLALRQGRTDSVCERLLATTGSYDYMLIEGGLNDCAQNIPLGEITDHYLGGYDTTTVLGALEEMCFFLITNHLAAEKLFILTHRNVSSTGTLSTKQNAYFDAMITVLEKWGVPYVDLRKVCGLAGINTSIQNTYFYQGDRIHPTREAYEKFYLPCIEKALCFV